MDEGRQTPVRRHCNPSAIDISHSFKNNQFPVIPRPHPFLNRRSLPHHPPSTHDHSAGSPPFRSTLSEERIDAKHSHPLGTPRAHINSDGWSRIGISTRRRSFSSAFISFLSTEIQYKKLFQHRQGTPLGLLGHTSSGRLDKYNVTFCNQHHHLLSRSNAPPPRIISHLTNKAIQSFNEVQSQGCRPGRDE